MKRLPFDQSSEDWMSEIDLTHVGDPVLVSSALSGSTSAFEELVKRYHRRVIAFCSLQLGSTEWGEDAAQETFLSAFRSLRTFSGEVPFYSWLLGIARNRCVDLARKRQRGLRDLQRHEAPRDQNEAISPSAENAIVSGDLCRKVLGELKDDARELFLMREAAGLSYEALAEQYDTSVESIRGKLKRTRTRLFQILRTITHSQEN